MLNYNRIKSTLGSFAAQKWFSTIMVIFLIAVSGFIAKQISLGSSFAILICVAICWWMLAYTKNHKRRPRIVWILVSILLLASYQIAIDGINRQKQLQKEAHTILPNLTSDEYKATLDRAIGSYEDGMSCEELKLKFPQTAEYMEVCSAHPKGIPATSHNNP